MSWKVKECVHRNCNNTFHVPDYLVHLLTMCQDCVNKKNNKEMKTVHDLRQEELEELRENYFHQLIDSGDLEEVGNGKIDCPTDIPLDNVKVHYEGTMFVDEDFWCNLADNKTN